MNIGRELATAMCMAQEVPHYGDDHTDGLERNMPSRAYNLEMNKPMRSTKISARERTPRTMPVGKMRPKETSWMMICTHSVESWGFVSDFTALACLKRGESIQ